MTPPAEPTPASSQAPAPAALRPPVSRRSALIGMLLALLLVAGLGGLTWYLTTRPAVSPAGAGGPPGRPVGGGGPGAGPAGGGRGPASTVGVATAERASVPVLLDALGTVTPQATVRVRAQVTGVLEKVLFTEGQTVRAGELLATIDPRQFQMALMQAAGQRQRDEAQLDSARVTLQRFKTLLEQDSIARQEVDTQAALVKQLEGTVAINRANEGTARLNLGYTRVVAPVSGRVGLRVVDVGNVVSPGDTNGMAVITQVSPIDVVFAVPQDRVGELPRPGAGGAALKVTAFDRTRSAVLATGTFASLDNQVDTSTGTVRAKARFANSELALFPNQFVNVQVLLRTVEGAVVVPVNAVRQGANGDYTYVLGADRTVALRQVRRGQATVDKVVITSGLQAGEQVITEGADRLKDGARVTVAGDAPQGGTGAVPGASRGPRPAGPASAPGSGPASAPSDNASGAAVTSVAPPLPSAEQRQRMLDRVKDDPAALAERKRFFEQLDQGDAAALARWRQMAERRRQGERAAP
jgi:membrane fusion protein, multidrug efflux system